MIIKRKIFQNIENQNKNTLKTMRRDAVKNILIKYKKVFDLISYDVSINFKKFNKSKHLETFVRVPSKYESIKYEDDNNFKRASTEIFTVSKNIDIKNLNPTKKLQINSAYTEVIYGKEKYWICNNLKKATLKNKYKSSSKDYEKFYNSLAVFAVADRISNKDEEFKIYGLLIFDTKKTHTFEHNITKELGGYLAHKLYYFLDRLNTDILVLNKNINKNEYNPNNKEKRVSKSNKRKSKKNK